MFDHSGWGRNLEAKEDGLVGEVGAWWGGRKGFLKPLFKHRKSCHAELMGLLTPLATMLSRCGTHSNSEPLIHPEVQRTRRSWDRSTWPGCPPASGARSEVCVLLHANPFYTSSESHSLSDQLKQDPIWTDSIFAQLMGKYLGKWDFNICQWNSLGWVCNDIINCYWYYWNTPKDKLFFCCCVYSLYSEKYLPES